MDDLEFLFKQAKKILNKAYSPYSSFCVASSLLTKNGNFYTGCNVENASYSVTICAESNAIGQMVTAGEYAINAILVIADSDTICTPCGACRQRINEFANEKTIVHMGNRDKIIQSLPLNELIPLAFGPKQLKEAL